MLSSEPLQTLGGADLLRFHVHVRDCTLVHERAHARARDHTRGHARARDGGSPHQARGHERATLSPSPDNLAAGAVLVGHPQVDLESGAYRSRLRFLETGRATGYAQQQQSRHQRYEARAACRDKALSPCAVRSRRSRNLGPRPTRREEGSSLLLITDLLHHTHTHLKMVILPRSGDHPSSLVLRMRVAAFRRVGPISSPVASWSRGLVIP